MSTWHIFSGGELLENSFIHISAADKVICADRGYAHAEKMGIVPDVIVGDFDSYTGKLPENTEIHRSVPEKDDTDTMLALKLAIDRGADNVKIYGALGGRFDHAFANVQALKYASEHGCRAVIEDSDNEICIQTAGEVTYPLRRGWYFSIFAYSEILRIKKLVGVKYPLENAELKSSFPLGTSNEIISGSALLSIESGTAMIVRSKMQP